ncbi:MAG: hypothetical protein V2A79_09920 [Planctomycetota bacterium]
MSDEKTQSEVVHLMANRFPCSLCGTETVYRSPEAEATHDQRCLCCVEWGAPTQHTARSWKAECELVLDSAGKEVARTNYKVRIEAYANALLIAAAPELLAVCKEIMRQFDEVCPPNMEQAAWDMLEAALRKAEGGLNHEA